MTDAQDWLPADTPMPPALDRAIGAAVAAWAGAWFAAAPPVARPVVRQALPNIAWRTLDTGVMIGVAEGGMVAVGAAILALPLADRPATDVVVLESVAEDSTADLRRRLAGMAGQAHDAGWAPANAPPPYVATIAVGVRKALAIGLSEAAFARLAKAAMAPQIPAALGDGQVALAAIPTVVGAMLGRARLTRAEVEALEIGDVIVLNALVDQPAPLTADGARLPRGSCAIGTSAAIPFLQIVDPVA